jgi:Tol biopolymer transport system component
VRRPLPVVAELVAALTVLLLAAGAASAAAPSTVAVSVTPSGATAADANRLGSLSPVISADGRWVAFESYAGQLVPGDTNDDVDVFVRDLRAGTTARVSEGAGGASVDGGAASPAISGDGRLVAFSSSSPALVPGDTNLTRCGPNDFDEECRPEPAADVFVRDILAATTRRVSVASSGRQGNDESALPVISANGRFVAFASAASNLVRRDRTRHVTDIFVHDLQRGTTRLVSVSSQGRQANADSVPARLSASGRYLAFNSDATNLVRGDTNRRSDVFVRDLKRGVTRRVSVSSRGAQANAGSWHGELSADGRYVAFGSSASNLVAGDTNAPADPDARETGADIFVRDLRRHRTRRVSVSQAGAQADGDSLYPAISGNGRYVAFASEARNLLPGRDANGTLMDIFIRDLRRDRLRRVSLSSGGRQPAGASAASSLSATGRVIAFESSASDLVAGDDNDAADVFLRRPFG